MSKKKKKKVPKHCLMGAIMTMAMYLIAELDMFDEDTYYQIYVRDIMAIEVSGRYVIFKMRDGNDIHQNHNIGYYRDKLSCTHFGKYHKSSILNKHDIDYLTTGRFISAYLFNGLDYEVSEDNNLRIKQDKKQIDAALVRKLKNII
jgi:DNA-binding LytR/AlgR family response regulator